MSHGSNPNGARMVLIFNTGRLYSQFGQIIKATLHDDQMVTFRDYGRLTDGAFKLAGGEHCFSKETIMAAYDHGISESTRRSYYDAFGDDGCNQMTDAEFKACTMHGPINSVLVAIDKRKG